MQAEIFAVKYADKHCAALVYRQILLNKVPGILACGMEKVKTTSKRIRTNLKLFLVLQQDIAKNLPALLRGLHLTLENHPLYMYLSFDYTAVPTSQVGWNFDSYDDPNYQKVFIQKRKNVTI